MKFIIGVLLGIIAGAAVGTVIASKPGKEAREELAERVTMAGNGQETVEAGVRRSVD